MGVKGLWQLLLPIGRRISIETLEGQVLAVDASIWLTQFLKAMRDPETGKVQPAAHLKGFFRRLCRLLYHNIKPVLVFDGPTPQVKAAELAARRRRREQFAHVSKDSMQRMARKLLHQNLLKERIQVANQGNAQAFERGFNPGDDDDDNVRTAQANNRAESQSSEMVDSDLDRKLPAASSETSQIIATNQQQYDDEEEVNDWDDPQETEQEQLLRLGLYDSDDDSDNNNQQQSDNHDNLDMSFLATLPPNRRKDAIEKAQRRHRIQSRKEHMPAAGDPFAFSQVQMANFLKSSRLNKSIQTSLAAAVKHDYQGGDVMASDTTTRLELIREDDHNTSEHKETKRLLRKRRRDESDSEEEPEWEISPSIAQKRNVSVGNGNVDDNILNDGETKLSARPFRSYQQNILQIEDSEDDEGADVQWERGGAGGNARLDNENNRLHGNQQHSPIAVDSDSETDGGGYIRTSDNGNSDANSLFQNHATTSLALEENAAQELQDRLLAEALQTEEYAESQHQLLAQDLQGKEQPNTQQSEKSQNLAICLAHNEDDVDVGVALSSSDEASIDWEDGEAAEMPKSSTLVNKYKDEDHEEHEDHEISVDDWEEGHKLENSASFDRDEDYINTRRTKKARPVADANAALERAQKEAAKLADWAGRIFRRAMKDAMPQKSTTTASPSRQIDESKQTIVASPSPANVITSSSTAVSLDTPTAKGDSRRDTSPRKRSPSRRQRAGRRVPSPAKKVSPIHRRLAGGLQSDTVGDAYTAENLDQALRLVEENSNIWAEERNKRERDTDTVTDEMKLEVMQLLELFGVPYLEAPAEAESQCAELERLGLVNGIVTDDSDVFVFGGKNVYKNIFEDQKFAEAYKAPDAEREMGLGQHEMVALAMLLGGDYTEGVKGVGIVNAMEILHAFDFSKSTGEGLRAFKAWLDGIDLPGVDSTEDNVAVKSFHLKHKSARNRWVTPDNFPVENVLKAYSQPVVDSSKGRFSWGQPDAAGLIVYCNKNIGWSTEETRALLNPVIDRPRTGQRQTRLDAYMPMRYEDSITFANVRSKRLQEVLQKNKTDKTSSEGIAG
ncbi:hypothetical protein MPSEU_000791600 [Mayamaea pseudoterrestris]|nr:hypothetical protein MPSEU_000791600 [Mayamaea pseudoterrestris]